MNTRPLRVLITRPAGLNLYLSDRLNQLGCETYLIPTVEILPAPQSTLEQFDELLRKGPAPDWLIFVSANAVRFGWPLVANYSEIVRSSRVAVVGPGSAKALSLLGVTPDAIPETQFDSEGVLSLAAFSKLQGQRIMIIRGMGGRPLMGEEMTRRGATVEYGECYQRRLPEQGREILARLLNDRRVDLVTITSRATLVNLFRLTPPHLRSALGSLDYLIMSDSILSTAEEFGVSGKVTVADELSDEGLCKTIQRLQSVKL